MDADLGLKGSERGVYCHAQFTGIKIENSLLTGIETDFQRMMHNSTFDFTCHAYSSHRSNA